MDKIIHQPYTKLLKAPEVAVILNCSKAFVYKLIKQRKLPSVQIGYADRIRLQDLWEFIEPNLTSREKR